MESGLEDITLAELIHMVIDSRLIDVHVSLPAKVESYDASTQTVSVTPMINRMVPDGDTPPNYVSEKLPKLADVPVAQPRGGGFFAAFPLQAGDYGMLVFAERNMGTYRSTGNQSDPGDLTMHGLSGAYFVPAVAPDSKALSNAHATNLVIGSDTNGSSRIVIKPSGEIDAGAAAANFVAMANKVLTELNSIATAFNSHTHAAGTYSNGGGGVTGVSATPNASMSPNAVASTNLKAEG